MICLRCRQDMVVVEYNKIELDYCPRCKGVWFDNTELDLLFESAKVAYPELNIKNLSNLPEVKSSERPRKCPICGKDMKEVAVGQPAVNIDVCRRQDGFWFDGGELREILSQNVENQAAKARSEQLVFGFLGEVFKNS